MLRVIILPLGAGATLAVTLGTTVAGDHGQRWQQGEWFSGLHMATD